MELDQLEKDFFKINEGIEFEQIHTKRLGEWNHEIRRAKAAASLCRYREKELINVLEGILRIKDLLGADDEYYNMPEHQGEGEAVYKAFQKIESTIAKYKK